MAKRFAICLLAGLFTATASPAPAAAQVPRALTDIYRAMRASDGGRLDGIAYTLSTGNRLDSGWVAQTPNVWGMRADRVPLGAGDTIVYQVRTLVESAQRFVDITSLAPFPSGQFVDAIQHGLVTLAQSGRPVTVRILVGWPSLPQPGGPTQSEFLQALIAPLKRIPSGRLTIYAAAQRTNGYSWNHAKIVAVDGARAMVGGENHWGANYLMVAPVHDLNVVIQGPAAYGMHQFADRLWGSVCEYRLSSWLPVHWKSGMPGIATGCLARHGLTETPGAGTVAVLGAGRFGPLVSEGDPADVGMAAALNSATDTIRISQQDLGFPPGLFWKAGMEAIAKALVANRDVYIVLTSDWARAGPDQTLYTTLITLAYTGLEIQKYIAGGDTPAMVNLLCRRLHLAQIRFGPSYQWPNGLEFANHAKFFMVDDRVFYVGSDNLYPSDLAEYGVFIGDSTAVRQMREQYWDKLWTYSKMNAMSGSEAPACIFRLTTPGGPGS